MNAATGERATAPQRPATAAARRGRGRGGNSAKEAGWRGPHIRTSLPLARPPAPRSQPIRGRYGTPRDPTAARPLGPAADVQARQKVAEKLFVAGEAGDEERTLPASAPGAAAVAPGGERLGAGGRGLASRRAPPRRHRGRLSREAGERGRVLTCLSSAWRVGKGGVGKEVGSPPRSSRSRGDPGREGGEEGKGEETRNRRTELGALVRAGNRSVAAGGGGDSPPLRPGSLAGTAAPPPQHASPLPTRPGQGSLCLRGGLAIPRRSWREPGGPKCNQAGGGRPLLRDTAHGASGVETRGPAAPPAVQRCKGGGEGARALPCPALPRGFAGRGMGCGSVEGSCLSPSLV